MIRVVLSEILIDFYVELQLQCQLFNAILADYFPDKKSKNIFILCFYKLHLYTTDVHQHIRLQRNRMEQDLNSVT